MTSPTQRAGADVLCEVEAYFEDREDVNDGDYGVPEPNEAMSLLRDVREAQATLAALQARIAELEGERDAKDTFARKAFDKLTELQEKLEAAEARNAASERDAGRYRWLRAQAPRCDGHAAVNWNIGHDWIGVHGEELDTAIDAHAQGQAGEEKDG